MAFGPKRIRGGAIYPAEISVSLSAAPRYRHGHSVIKILLWLMTGRAQLLRCFVRFVWGRLAEEIDVPIIESLTS